MHSIARVQINFFWFGLHEPLSAAAPTDSRVNLFALGGTGRAASGSSSVPFRRPSDSSTTSRTSRRDPVDNLLENTLVSDTDARPFHLGPFEQRSRAGTRGGGRKDLERGNAVRRPRLSQRRALRREGM